MAEGTFSELLARVRPEVERLLRKRWDTKVLEVQQHGPGVMAMAEAARDLTLRGGKRFRAALVCASYLGVAPRARFDVALEAGAALELLQSYLLMQDDWMDGDRTRRGGPSVHTTMSAAFGSARLGASSAILASNLTWGLALETLAGLRVSPERRVAAIRLLTRIHGDVVIGQQLDLLGRAEDVEAMHALKTGSYTVHGPLALGATLAGASKRTLAALCRFAQPLGVAFQLRDDLMGAFGEPAETGKPRFGDLRGGRRTAILAEAERRLDPAGRRSVARVLGRRGAGREALRRATDALADCGAGDIVAARLVALCERAAALAAELPVTPRSRIMLRGAAMALRWSPLAGSRRP